ncbi:hypothetical protein [Anaeromyxobacter oryzisoli]|nr:hypothetical protein [Anaeromyxobacter sp. SG63]
MPAPTAGNDGPRRALGAPPMFDVLYLLTTVAFFALSIAYVSGCDRL